MRAFVFTDPALARHAGRFVWLAINTEQARNAEFRRKFPAPALPTFLILDPANETVAVRWVGGMTVAQANHLLAQDPLTAKRHPQGLAARLARADSLYGAGADSAAAAAYQSVLAEAPQGWADYPRVVDALSFSLSQTDQNARLLEVARAALPRLSGTPTLASVSDYGLDAALALPADAPGRAAAIAEFEAACRRVLADTALAIAADDRSGIYGSLVSARDDANDKPGHDRVAAEWARYLEGEAARARTKEQRAVFDPHRLSAYLELGTPEKAIPMLEQSRREFPDDYNPPARLAIAYLAMKDYDKALAASNAAMAKAYGPRKLRIYDTRSQIQAGAGDSTAAKHTLEQAVAYGDSLPDPRPQGLIASLRKKLGNYR